MKALVIAPQPFFSPRGTPYSVYYRTMVTAQMGVEIDLLTYGQGEDPDIPGVTIHRIPNFKMFGKIKTGPSALKLFLDGFIVLWALGLLLRNRYDVVHAHEEAVFFCRFFKPIFGFKMIYDMHSSLPQQLTNFSFTKSKLLIGTFAWLEDQALAHADAAITICPELAEYAIPRVADPARHFLIENSIFEPVRLKNTATSSGAAPEPVELPAGREIVGYAGTFESYQGIEIVVAAFAEVIQQRPKAFLLMVGGNPQQVEEHRKLADSLGLTDSCLFTGTVPQSLAKHYMALATVLLSPRREGMNTPLKIYEQLASGQPLVATRIHAHTQVLDDEVCFLVDPNPESMAAGILEALDDSPRRRAVIDGARALYEREYSRTVYEAKLGKLLESLR